MNSTSGKAKSTAAELGRRARIGVPGTAARCVGRAKRSHWVVHALGAAGRIQTMALSWMKGVARRTAATTYKTCFTSEDCGALECGATWQIERGSLSRRNVALLRLHWLTFRARKAQPALLTQHTQDSTKLARLWAYRPAQPDRNIPIGSRNEHEAYISIPPAEPPPIGRCSFGWSDACRHISHRATRSGCGALGAHAAAAECRTKAEGSYAGLSAHDHD